MSFPVALDARHVLLPVNLFRQDGSRLMGPLPKLGTVSAMVVGLTGKGVVFQEMHPLALRAGAAEPFDGAGWELRSLPVGMGYHAYYLGVPDTLFVPRPEGDAKIQALSLEVIGSSVLGPSGAFSGGADLHLEAEAPVPAPVALIQLLERFYPDLWLGLDQEELELLRDPTDGSWVLSIPFSGHPLRTPPPAQSPRFHPRMHMGAAIEGLRSKEGTGYWVIRAGCFREANGRLGHWFGQRFGPVGWAFRRTAATIAQTVADPSHPGWLLWLQPVGVPENALPEWMGPPAIRHAALHQALSRGFLTQRETQRGLEEVHAALLALEGLARLWLLHQEAILAWRSGPPASEWRSGDDETAAYVSSSGDDLQQVATDFIAKHGDGLRVLERLQEEEWESAALRHPVDRLLRPLVAKGQKSAQGKS